MPGWAGPDPRRERGTLAAGRAKGQSKSRPQARAATLTPARGLPCARSEPAGRLPALGMGRNPGGAERTMVKREQSGGRRPAVAIGILAFAIRCAVLAISWHGGGGAWNLSPDSGRYRALADSFTHGHGFTIVDVTGERRPEYLTLPAYPVLLAGLRTLGTDSPLPALVLAGAATALAAGAVAALTQLAGPAAGLLAGLLLACDGQSIAYSNLLLTDALGVACITLALAILALYTHRRSPGLAWASGLAVGAAVFLRPANIVLMPIAAVGMIAAYLGRDRSHPLNIGFRARLRMLSHILLFLGLASLPVLSWSARNRERSGMWFYSTSPDVVLVRWQLPRLYAEIEGMSVDEARQRIATELDIESTYTTLGVRPPEYRPRAQALSARLASQHPVAFARIFLAGVARVAVQPDGAITQLLGHPVTEGGLATGAIGFGEALRRRWQELGGAAGSLYFLQLPYLAGLWLLGAVGAWRGLARPGLRALTVSSILGAGIFVLIAGGYPGDPRYRLPALPFLSVLAAIGATSFGRVRKG